MDSECSGSALPLIGLGTYQLKGSICEEIVSCALCMGYRLVDTARCYKNECEVGKGLSRSGIARREIFITSKISTAEHGEDAAFKAVITSIDLMQCEYLDLVLIHWPGVRKIALDSPINREQRLLSWKGLIRAMREGLCRHIGVSNFTRRHMEELIDDMKFEGMEVVMPFCNQFELHPLCSQVPLREYCNSLGVRVQAYSSLGSGSIELLDHPIVKQVSDEVHLSAAEVLLRWALQQDIAVIPKSKSVERLEKNLIDLRNRCLSDDHIGLLNGIDEGRHFCWDPNTVL